MNYLKTKFDLIKQTDWLRVNKNRKIKIPLNRKVKDKAKSISKDYFNNLNQRSAAFRNISKRSMQKRLVVSASWNQK